ncbi:rod shape-determining protein MreC [bacterium]|nr:rod shape-determining protein MreC [bacterium]
MFWKLKNFLDGFYQIIDVYKNHFVFLFLIIISAILLQTNTNPQITFFRQRAIYLSALIGEQFSRLPRVWKYEDQNRTLELQNTELAKRNIVLEDAYLENIKLRQMLKFKDRFPLNTIPAHIIMKAPDPNLSTITLDKGRDDGVYEYQNVITDRGLVGIITHVEDRYSVCQIMLDKTFRAAAKIQRTRLSGIALWQGLPNEVGFYGVLKNLDVRVGDVILTSEYSEFFLPNFRVGIVREINNEIEGIFKNIHVKTSVDFDMIEDVFIVQDTSKVSSTRIGFENYFFGNE